MIEQQWNTPLRSRDPIHWSYHRRHFKQKNMKIRVTLIILLSIGFAASTKNQRTFVDDKFNEGRNFVRRSESKHRVFEHSRSIDTVNVDVATENEGSKSQRSKSVHNSEDPESSLSGTLDEGSERSLKRIANVRINSKQPSRILETGGLPLGDKVLSRKKKDKMEQAVLPLLMAYKMKFAALIPVLVGGMALLFSTTALAGFFFALFAAVLGLKAH